ncbi:MAG TPA: ABC transporter ATP-binding protein [Solirubrobacterales bacterium]|nr:ABC transporter ATP-binding protein [Solirubrobacterales bacterium]
MGAGTGTAAQREIGSAPAERPVVDAQRLARRYEIGDVTVTALEEVSLRIAQREFIVVLGPSGSGKTTLLNLLGALDSPTAGRITVAGKDITRASRRELVRFRRDSVGFIFQSFNLFPELTAFENVEFGFDVTHRRDGRDRARETLDRVGLGARFEHFPHELSGGEQQRVAIARALVARKPLLLADEPTGELDFRTGVQILELLHEQTHDLDTAVIVVTHNREISRVAHRVIELSSGRIVSDRANERPADIAELRW